MTGLFAAIFRKQTVHRFFAAAFLFVLLAEWGSHSIICADHSDADAQSISATDHGHEDPCQTLVVCGDTRQKDHQQSNLGHDASQHNALFDRLSGLGTQIGLIEKVKIPFASGDAVFRPPRPPFHPPKLS